MTNITENKDYENEDYDYWLDIYYLFLNKVRPLQENKIIFRKLFNFALSRCNV